MSFRPKQRLPRRSVRVFGQTHDPSRVVGFLEAEIEAKEQETEQDQQNNWKEETASVSSCPDVVLQEGSTTEDQASKRATASLSSCADVVMPDAPTTVVHLSDFGEDNSAREARLTPNSPTPWFPNIPKPQGQLAENLLQPQQQPYPELNGAADMAFSFGTSTSKPTLNLGGMNTTEPANPGNSLL